jgi:hypothetical protein
VSDSIKSVLEAKFRGFEGKQIEYFHIGKYTYKILGIMSLVLPIVSIIFGPQHTPFWLTTLLSLIVIIFGISTWNNSVKLASLANGVNSARTEINRLNADSVAWDGLLMSFRLQRLQKGWTQLKTMLHEKKKEHENFSETLLAIEDWKIYMRDGGMESYYNTEDDFWEYIELVRNFPDDCVCSCGVKLNVQKLFLSRTDFQPSSVDPSEWGNVPDEIRRRVHRIREILSEVEEFVRIVDEEIDSRIRAGATAGKTV